MGERWVGAGSHGIPKLQALAVPFFAVCASPPFHTYEVFCDTTFSTTALPRLMLPAFGLARHCGYRGYRRRRQSGHCKPEADGPEHFLLE